MFDCSSEMKSFHGDKVTLSTDTQDEMRERRNNGRIRLSKGLERDGHRTPAYYAQGSHAMHTMVQDDAKEFDIDDGAYFPLDALADTDGVELTTAQAKERVCDAIRQDQRMKEPADVHDNCVRQMYPTGYHIDIPVYRVKSSKDAHDNKVETYELAAKDTWEPSDAREVTRWFLRQIAAVGEKNDGEQLRRVVRLTKSFARSREGWSEKTGSGIVLTCLVCDKFSNALGRDDEALRKTWQGIEARLVESRVIAHPVNAGNLADEGDEKVGFFLDKLSSALNELEILDTNCTRREAREAWDAVFDTTYFTRQPTPDKRLEVDESKADHRNDGGGVYG